VIDGEALGFVLKVDIEAEGIEEALVCSGETHVVNLHGAFISSAIARRFGLEWRLMSGKCTPAKVAFVDPERPRLSLPEFGKLGLAIERHPPLSTVSPRTCSMATWGSSRELMPLSSRLWFASMIC
jgi:hypothetical protein